ncbi:versican core protein-like isoform X4 [Macrosteles quadrilineatus]|uniref:versican core protein-like isoform X4 n=1 Tax=Macrosteles quadrilineatus TaxID=74068 RepID=UPI0023E2B402|nr:versican core protein-like isoform X4 [Macrosteles quadrilineatus]
MDSRIVCLCLLVLFVDKSRTQPVNNTTTGEECISNDECISGKICIAKKCTDPCDGVCGLNTICVVQEGDPLCSCKTGYDGDPFTECKPENAECTDDSMCTTDKTCIGHKCVDPCMDHCGLNTVCRVVNHRPVCACLKGFLHTLDKGCLPESSTDNKENKQKTIKGNKIFILVNEKKAWYRAYVHCRDHGMNLAAIENDDEWNNFASTIRNKVLDVSAWIGGNAERRYPDFRWISTGQPLSYTHWRAGEPSGFFHCLAASREGFANYDCYQFRSFVCELSKIEG